MEPKKLLILRILQILEYHTDFEHKLTQQQIIDLLNSEYGIVCERKAVARNISYLREADFDIENDKDGFYLVDRKFERSELRLLIDSVLSSRYIDNKNSANLIEKLARLGGKYFTSSVKHIFFNKNWAKTDNTDVFYNIDILNEAIDKKIQVSFTYNKYDLHKKLVPRKSEPYIVNPYQMLLHNQRYYLICNIDKYNDIRYLRMDRITDIALSTSPSKPIKALDGYGNGLQLSQLDTALPYMFGDKITPITVRCKNELIGDIIDWFGTKFYSKLYGNDHIDITVNASCEAMKYWALQYADNIEIISPISLREDIAKSVNRMYNIYNKVV